MAIARKRDAGKTAEETGRLQRFIEQARCYDALPRRAHKPDLHFARVRNKQHRDLYLWIMDGKQRVGLVNMEFGEIELFHFLPPEGGRIVPYKMREIYTWLTLKGARICLVPQGGRGLQDGELAGLASRGETVTLSYSETRDGDMLLKQDVTLRFDPLLGYVLDCDFDLRMEKPRKFEYANLLAGGLAECRDDRKRFQKCVWTRKDGKLCYMYQNPLSLMQRFAPRWRDMPAGGFVGWVAEPDMNPFLEMIQSTPTTFETCDEWYDQHVFGKAPTRKSADGFYYITATYRLLSLPFPVAKELEDAARTMLPLDDWDGKIGFLQGVVNDCETLVPPGTLYNGCLWTKTAQLARRMGHSGKQSIRVKGGQTAEPILGGAPIGLERGRRYRFAAWVRTRGATGKGVRLRLDEVVWSWNDCRATYFSKALKGNNDWTRLEVEFAVRTFDPIAKPGLVVEGEGTAWFDDIELVEVGK
ncbi:MAG: hypothetical protein QGH42_03875 [Kiritimatiellia bacterium]|nr:hypothetical protein [Kiritimatiellia bacterium]MDP6810908.1 hypothetical protein [Kiritimatiellia bacterium]MDP7023374.1 hypothetical protein [Kiritimatiellia bacterium]